MTFETKKAFLEDAYLKACAGKVVGIQQAAEKTEITRAKPRGIILDSTNFYATSGGQPGDRGWLQREDGSRIEIFDCVTGADKNEIVLVPAPETVLPEIGENLVGHIDWERRYKLMQMHTACHLLSVACPYPITSANVAEDESRVDFDIPAEKMGSEITKEIISNKMMKLVQGNHSIYSRWITEAELDANPDIVRSKNVRPPRGMGDIRLVVIGGDGMIDSQPCGGTHVANTKEVGLIHISKIENKGKENRRFRIRFVE